MALWIHLIGIAGVLVIAINFILEASDKLAKDHNLFVQLNFISSMLLFTYSVLEHVILFAILNMMLVLISIYEMIILARKKKNKDRKK